MVGYKLIALDLDGTLLGSDHAISPRAREALRRARAAGVRVTLASGRSYQAMRPWVEELGIQTPVISYQGAVLTDPLTGRHAFERLIAATHVDEIVAFAERHALSLTLYTDDTIYVRDKRESDAFYERWFGLPWRIVPDLRSALPGPPVKFILVGRQDELDAVQPHLAEQFAGRLEILRSHTFFLEGLALGVTKGSALEWLAGQLGIAREETIACGDEGNDVAMVRWAGLGVAMGNGTPELKAVADVVAPSADEDGVAQVVERYCLGEEVGADGSA